MLSYFALITLVKLSGILLPFIWFLFIANRRGRIYGFLVLIALFIVSFVNTYFSLPDLAYPAMTDNWLMWLIGGFIVVAVLKRFVYSPNAVAKRTTDAGNGLIGQIIQRFTGAFGWLVKLP